MFGLLSGIVAVPAITGTTQAIEQARRNEAKEKHRGRKSNLVVTLPRKNIYSSTFDGSLIVLKDNKLYIDTTANEIGTSPAGHLFAGYYLPHPQNQSRWKGAGWRGEGMVSTISDDPPMLNWIYVDVKTNEVKYGTRADTTGHVVGPWDCTEIDKRVTFEGWEGFLAVQEDQGSGLWALYFDRNDDALGGRKIRRLRVQLTRREMDKTKVVADEERLERQQHEQEQEAKRQQREKEKKTPITQVFPPRQQTQDKKSSTPQQEEEIDE